MSRTANHTLIYALLLAGSGCARLAVSADDRSRSLERVEAVDSTLPADRDRDRALAYSLADAVLTRVLTGSGMRPNRRAYGGEDPSTRVVLLVSDGLPDGYRPALQGFDIRVVSPEDLPGQISDPVYAHDDFTYLGMAMGSEGGTWGRTAHTVTVGVWTVASSRRATSTTHGSSTAAFQVDWDGDTPSVHHLWSQSI